MTDEVRKVIKAIKEASEVFERMELPIAEREYTLSHNAAMALINELEQVKQERDGLNIRLGQAQSMLETRTRERDAAIDDLNAHRPCDACEYYELQGNNCIECRRYTDRPYWKWCGVEESSDA